MMKNCSGIIRLSPFAMEELTEFLVSAQSATCYSGVSRNNRYFFSRSFSCVLSYERVTSLLLRQSVSDHRVAWIARPTCVQGNRDLFINLYGTWHPGFLPAAFIQVVRVSRRCVAVVVPVYQWNRKKHPVGRAASFNHALPR